MHICVWYMCTCVICNIYVSCICIVYTHAWCVYVCVYCIGLCMHVYCVFAGDLDHEAHVEARG